MPSLNKAILIGYICADPELKQTPNGAAVTSFRIGVSRRFKDANGSYATDFISIVAWRQTAEFICKYFKKGSCIVIDGSIQVRTYEKDGTKRYITEVIVENVGFGDGKSKDSVSEQPQTSEPKFEELDPNEGLPF